MAEQPQVADSVSPEQFFEQLLPAGFVAQAQARGAVPGDFTMQYRLTGEGGGDWTVAVREGGMTAARGRGEANLTFTLGVEDWRDCVLGRNGATLGVIVPQGRAGRPDNSGRAKLLRGTLALELARETSEPLRVEMCFNNAAAPRTLMKIRLADWVAMQEGRLNGQEAFMSGKMKIEGDLAFLMQLAALNA